MMVAKGSHHALLLCIPGGEHEPPCNIDDYISCLVKHVLQLASAANLENKNVKRVHQEKRNENVMKKLSRGLL